MSTLLDLEPTSERSGTTPARHRRRSRQAKCLVSGGVVFAVGNALHPLEHTDAAYQAATWEAAHLVILASIPLLVLGLPVVHRMLRGRVSDRWALLPVVSVMVGLIGIAPGAVIEAFVAPRVGNAAMDELASGGMGIVDAVFGVAFLGGSLALGYALRQAGVRPRWAGPGLMVIAGVLLVSMGLSGPVGGGVIISATIAYGSALAILGLRA